MRIQDIPQVSYQIALSKGWWEEDRPFVNLVMLADSEVAEALEDYRNNHKPNEMWFKVHELEGVTSDISTSAWDKPCGIPSELADVVIRIGDMIGRITDPNITNPAYDHINRLSLNTVFPVDVPQAKAIGTFVEGLYRITARLTSCIHEDPSGQLLVSKNLPNALTWAVYYCFTLANQFDIDLMRAIELKTAYNQTRPKRHGGKKI